MTKLKNDPDRREPPNSVGMSPGRQWSFSQSCVAFFAAVVSNLFVLPSHRGAGIGAELLRTALQHSTYTKLRAVELEVDSVEENARKLCEGQDWVLEVMSPKKLFRILRLDKYLYRRACTVWPQTEILE